MKFYKIVGGPHAMTVRLIDPDTGESVPGITRIALTVQPGEMVTAEVSMIVDVDIEINADQITLGEVLNLADNRLVRHG